MVLRLHLLYVELNMGRPTDAYRVGLHPPTPTIARALGGGGGGGKGAREAPVHCMLGSDIIDYRILAY